VVCPGRVSNRVDAAPENLQTTFPSIAEASNRLEPSVTPTNDANNIEVDFVPGPSPGKPVTAQANQRHGLFDETALASLDAWVWTESNFFLPDASLDHMLDLDPWMSATTDAPANHASSMIQSSDPHGLGSRQSAQDISSSIRGRYSDIRFPALSKEDEAVLAIEDFGEAPRIQPVVWTQLLDFCVLHSDLVNRDEFADACRVFVELYFRHFAPAYPFVHPSSLVTADAPWILLLHVALTGSQYSAISQGQWITEALRKLAQQAIDTHFTPSQRDDDLVWGQIHLLRDLNLFYSGAKSLLLKQQFSKTAIISLCRALKQNLTETLGQNVDVGAGDGSAVGFEQWVRYESCIRLFHHAYRNECLQYILLDFRPTFDLEELTLALPCDEALWNCHTEEERRRLLRIPSTQRRSHLSDHPQMSSLDELNSTFRRELRYLYTYVDHRLAISACSKSPLRELLANVAMPTNAMPPLQWPVHADSNSVIDSLSASVDHALSSLMPSTGLVGEQAPPVKSQHGLSFMLRILRVVPLRTLHALSGWQATGSQIMAARNSLQALIQTRPEKARQGFIYALITFAVLRAKTPFEPHEPLCMLAAVLYIWIYHILTGLPQAGPSSGEPTETILTLRFEDSINIVTCNKWISSGCRARFYVAGVGFLDGKTSPARLLHDFRRTLQNRHEWRSFCQSLARNVQQLIDGENPHFQDD
jgi:hypothetical protein